jgi:non-specific serine/threonine protein kinase
MAPDQSAWLDRLEREHDNVRGALRLALDGGEAEEGMRLAAALWRFWFQRGYLREGRSWLEAFFTSKPEATPATRAKAETALGGLAYWLSDVDATQTAYESALDLYREMGDREGEIEALYNLSSVPVMRGDIQESRRRLEASLALARQIERWDLVAQSRLYLSSMTATLGDPQSALTLLEEALTFFRSEGNSFGLGGALIGLAKVHGLLGQYQAGRACVPRGTRSLHRGQEPPEHGRTVRRDLDAGVRRRTPC